MQASKSSPSAVETQVKPKAASAVEAHKEKFMTKRNVFEDAMREDRVDGYQFEEPLRVEETKTMETEYIQSEGLSRPIIQPSRLRHDE